MHRRIQPSALLLLAPPIHQALRSTGYPSQNTGAPVLAPLVDIEPSGQYIGVYVLDPTLSSMYWTPLSLKV